LNVYRLGQPLFKIEWNGKTGALRVSTHPKYLVDPDLYKVVPFDGSAFDVEELGPLIKRYEGVDTLAKMKRAAKVYHGEEKAGVHAVARNNENNVIDTEVAFSRKAEAEKGPFVPRVDIACLKEVKGSIKLRFWEAKLYTDGEIRADGDAEPPVVGQVRNCRKLVENHRDEILQSYRIVARNLVEMASWVAPQRKVGKLVERVARGETVEIDKIPMVGLIIYGCDVDQRKSKRWEKHLDKLTKEARILVCCRGEAKNIIPWRGL
jgi:hypothetical protein